MLFFTTMKKLPAVLALLFIFCLHSYSQQATIKGTVIDTSEKRNLANSVVALLRPVDSVLVSFTRTDAAGHFTLQKLSPGQFLIMVTRPAYADYYDKVNITGDGTVDLGNISLILKSQLLQEVVVTRKLGAIRIKGDTTEYIADSFKLDAGATVEDLLKKLPGIQVDKDGKITAQGETVQKVLVDGEEFFSDDPTIATRGLTSDAVDKVQVYDKKSDQAAFTGIDDGQKTKTIDLKLKEDKKKGYFGKVETGTDGNKYWNNSAMLNAFKGKRKFSAFGIMSNTGKTGLDWDENMNYGNSSGVDMGMSEDGGMWMSMSGDEDFGYGNYYGQGLPKGWAGGMHYSNKWNGDKMHLNSGYQFNKLNVAARGVTQNQTILPGSILYVNENGNSFSSKDRHKLNGMYEWQIDSMASVKITMDGSKGSSRNLNNFHSESFNNLDDTLSIIDRQVTSITETQKFNTTLLWKQKFKKRGRTFSLSARQSYNENESTGSLTSDNYFFNNGGTTLTKIDQQKLRDNISAGVNARGVYTEPLSKRSLLEFNYSIDNMHRQSRIATLEKTNPDSVKYVRIVDSLSNEYSFNVLTHNGGIAYRYAKPKRLTISFGVNVSKAFYTRKDLQTDSMAKYNFTNFYPQANFTWNLGSNGNLRLNYNGNTQAPSIDQIQPIQDNTDQLNIRIGNPNLKQAFRHNARLSYDSYKFLSERSLFTSFDFNTTQNDFSTINFIDEATGKKIYQPVNVNGNYHVGNWSYYYKKLKKLNLFVGGRVSGSMNRNINYIDDLKNVNRNYQYTLGPTISYYKEKKWSWRIEARFSRNISKSSLRPEIVTRYWIQEHYADVNVHLPWKLEIQTDVSFNFRQKISAFDKNNNAIRWNARLDRKILKNDAARIRFQAFDMLDQNIDFNRNTNSNFSSESTYDTLRRYFMLSLIWNFNKNGKPM
jgi:hypothetical protein